MIVFSWLVFHGLPPLDFSGQFHSADVPHPNRFYYFEALFWGLKCHILPTKCRFGNLRATFFARETDRHTKYDNNSQSLFPGKAVRAVL